MRQVRSIEKTETSECMVCHVQHTVLISQLCYYCAIAAAGEDHPERINAVCNVLKSSSKQFKYNRRCTVAAKTATERVLVGTVLSKRAELYHTLNNFNKTDFVEDAL